jgi:2EXR family
MQGILNQLKAILQSNQERLKPKEPVTFTKFSRFPPEIRVMVWHHAATIPQLIGVDDWPGGRFDGTPLKGAPIRCPLLLVNWEARIEVLKFKKNLNCRDWEENRRDPKIYANLDTDIIWLRSHFDMNGYRDRDWARFFQKLRQGRLRKVRRLAIGYQMYKYLLNEDLWHRQPVTFFDLNVEEVILLVNQQAVGESEMAEIVDPGARSENGTLALPPGREFCRSWKEFAKWENMAMRGVKRIMEIRHDVLVKSMYQPFEVLSRFMDF